MTVSLPVNVLDSTIGLPSYAYEGDAGLCLRSTEHVFLKPFERATVSCGFSMAIPEGYAGLVIPRSGMAARHGISIVNAPGLIDSGYRGEVKVVLINLDSHETYEVGPGDNIAQLVIVAVPHVDVELVESLSETERGAGGFGSSGKA